MNTQLGGKMFSCQHNPYEEFSEIENIFKSLADEEWLSLNISNHTARLYAEQEFLKAVERILIKDY